MSKGIDYTEALAHLKASDRKLAKWIEHVGEPAQFVERKGSIYLSLLESIVFQQLAGKAAATILGRVKALFPKGKITPELLLAKSDEELRTAGLSRNKLAALRDLSAKSLDGTLPEARAMARLTDEQIVTYCTQVRGVGRWTVEMLLIFRLGRPDVLPLDDYGLRKGFQKLYELKDLPTKEQMLRRGAKWSPHATLASWYLWRVLDFKNNDVE